MRERSLCQQEFDSRRLEDCSSKKSISHGTPNEVGDSDETLSSSVNLQETKSGMTREGDRASLRVSIAMDAKRPRKEAPLRPIGVRKRAGGPVTMTADLRFPHTTKQTKRGGIKRQRRERQTRRGGRGKQWSGPCRQRPHIGLRSKTQEKDYCRKKPVEDSNRLGFLDGSEPS